MSAYFNPVPLLVVDGDTAKAQDLNSYGTSLDASFDLVEVDIANTDANAVLYAGISQTWAENPEDVEVEVGKYSSLHWSAKSSGYSAISSNYATNSENSSLASEASNVASGVARDASVAAQGLSETARDASVVAQGLSETAQGLSETARDASVVAQGLSEDARDLSNTYAGTSLTHSNTSQLRAWDADAGNLTSASYSTEAEDVLVKAYTSDGDGTFTATDTTDYSSLHYAAKSFAYQEFPTGTAMSFFQAAAPTGWTQDITNTDAMLRVVGGAGGGAGGTDSAILNDKVPIHAHTASSGLTGAHSHTINAPADNYIGVGNIVTGDNYSAGRNIATSSDGDHTHTVTVDNNAGSNWTPKYVDLIICVKD